MRTDFNNRMDRSRVARQQDRRRIVRRDRLRERLFPHGCQKRFMAVVLACVLLPMFALVAWLVANPGLPRDRTLLAVAVGLASTMCCVWIALALMREMMRPLRRAVAALERYEHEQVLPHWPETWLADDDMGRLLRGLQQCLQTVDAGKRQLEELAREDSLTRAMNRRGTQQALRASVDAAHAAGGPFVLFVVDLDNLKQINDEHGHAAGDFALASIVSSARECCVGKGDWIGRWGGDEFLLGLHADPQIAFDRVRLWIRVLAEPQPGCLPVHVSAGAAVLEPGLDAQGLYRRADAVMYRAKFAGGRRLLESLPSEQASQCA